MRLRKLQNFCLKFWNASWSSGYVIGNWIRVSKFESWIFFYFWKVPWVEQLYIGKEWSSNLSNLEKREKTWNLPMTLHLHKEHNMKKNVDPDEIQIGSWVHRGNQYTTRNITELPTTLERNLQFILSTHGLILPMGGL